MAPPMSRIGSLAMGVGKMPMPRILSIAGVGVLQRANN